MWSSCTASLSLIAANAARIGPDRSSSYADEGTEAHNLAEKLLTGQITEDDVPEQFAPVLEYVRACRTLIHRWDGEVFIEAKVPLFYLLSETGTVDFCIVTNDRVIIRDLKYGAGQFVDATDNQQLAIYAMSFIRDNDVTFGFADEDIVDIGIIQPRYAGEETERNWTLTVGELRKFCEPIAEAAKAILRGWDDAEYAAKYLVFRPSYDACFWCKASRAGICKAKNESLNALKPGLLDGFDTETANVIEMELVEQVQAIETRTVTDAQIVAIIRHSKLMESIIESAKAYANDRANAGNPLPGMKRVEGKQGNRAWSDEVLAAQMVRESAIKDAAFETKLKSPTQVLKLLKDGGFKAAIPSFETIVQRAPGKPVAVMLEDPRPELTSPLEGFDDSKPTEQDGS